MYDRKNVILVMFDLPVVEPSERKISRKFVKFLKKQGFMMFQESIYVKLLGNGRNPESDLALVRKNAPEKGTVCSFATSLAQFKKSLFLGDSTFDFSVFSDDFVIV